MCVCLCFCAKNVAAVAVLLRKNKEESLHKRRQTNFSSILQLRSLSFTLSFYKEKSKQNTLSVLRTQADSVQANQPTNKPIMKLRTTSNIYLIKK